MTLKLDGEGKPIYTNPKDLSYAWANNSDMRIVTFHLLIEEIKQINKLVRQGKYKNRSDFIRQAISQELKFEGVK